MSIVYQRTLAGAVKTISDNFPVLLLTGPRQVGKTTFLEMCAGSDRNYVTLDDVETRSLACNEPGLFPLSEKATAIPVAYL